MNVKIELNESKIREKVTNDRFGKFTASEWKRLIDPYTPRDTGNLLQRVEIRPFELYYYSTYAHAVYRGKNMTFQKKNPYSTYEWDKAAAKAGQSDKLCRTLNNALQSGQY